jgi:hypothetical protein
MARRVGQYCGQIFRYAVVTGRAERNPTTDLKGALKPVRHGHFSSIEPEELPDSSALSDGMMPVSMPSPGWRSG